MRISELFQSIDGEGIFTGMLATFVRLHGCNLRCTYCDTLYAQKLNGGFFYGDNLSVEDVVSKVEAAGNKHVTITGGEPLIHAGCYDLVKTLSEKGYIVNIETNGSIDIRDYLMPNVVITMDYKLDCSMQRSKMNENNLSLLRECDVLKFVTDGSDDEWKCIKDVLTKWRPKANVFLSPVYGKCEPVKVVSMLKQLSSDKEIKEIIDRARVGLQIHKLIWDANKRGV